MNSSNEAYRCHLANHLPALTRQPETAQRLRFLMDRVLALVLVDLEPARPLLGELYCIRSGGRPARDPVCMLRCLLLMLLCGETSVNVWAARLKGEPELVVLSGFMPDAAPGVGTFYDFFHRLLDGPYQRRCKHDEPASERVRGRGFRRVLVQEKESGKEQTQAQLAQSNQRKVAYLVDQALAARQQPLPQDLEQRLNEILMRCAVVPSALAGLLGDLKRLKVAADGTAIDSGANGQGHTNCTCRQEGDQKNCTCPREYSDPEATWGYDSMREDYFFGYRLHHYDARGTGAQDLPLAVSIAEGHTPDVVMAVDGFCRLVKSLNRPELLARIYAGIYDAGYDAEAFYKLHQEHKVCPVIPLAKEEVQTPTCAQGLPRDSEGRPLCPGNLPMRLHQRDLGKQKLLYNCPVKRPGREEGKFIFRVHQEECPLGALCEPQTVMGPLVHIRLGKDPRMDLVIPRGSAEFEELYKDRTSTERYNSTVKSKGRMAQGAYRRKHFVFTMAVLHAIEKHAMAWVDLVFARQRPRTAAELLEWLSRQQQSVAQAA